MLQEKLQSEEAERERVSGRSLRENRSTFRRKGTSMSGAAYSRTRNTGDSNLLVAVRTMYYQQHNLEEDLEEDPEEVPKEDPEEDLEEDYSRAAMRRKEGNLCVYVNIFFEYYVNNEK